MASSTLAHEDYGTTQRQIALAASKNHFHGSPNDKAQYQFKASI